MAEYGADTDYEIKWRRPTDLDDQGRGQQTVLAVGPVQNPEWEATIDYTLDDAGIMFTKIALKSTGGDIPSTLWKKFPLGDIRRYLRESLVDDPSLSSAGAILHDYGPPAASDEERRWHKEQKRRAEEAAEVLRTSKPQRGPGRKNDEHWRAITDVYLDSVRIGGRRSVYWRMAKSCSAPMAMRLN